MSKQLYQSILCSVVGLFLIFLPLGYELWRNDNNQYLIISSGGLSILLLLSFWRVDGGEFKWRKGDVIAIIYLLYNMALLLISDKPTDPILWFEWSCIVMLYLLVRIQSGNKFVILFFIASVCIQSLYGLIQKFIFHFSNHPLFSLTGSFENPGPLGGYLAIGMILLSSFLFNSHSIMKYLIPGIIILIVIGVTIYYTDSRAAWLSAIVPLLLLFISRIRVKQCRIVICVVFTIVLLIVLAGLFKYKENSANARLFIWEVSISEVSNHLVLGKGISSFPGSYMYAQADYFRKQPHSGKACIAANNTHAFNEYIRVWFEHGLIGLILCLSLIITALLSPAKKDVIVTTSRMGLISLLVFSLFSYPTDILPLKLMFPLFLGMLPGKQIRILSFRKPNHRMTEYSIVSLFVFFISLGIYGYQFNANVNQLLEKYYFEGCETTGRELVELYPRFSRNKELVLKYGKILFINNSFEKAIPVLEKAAEFSPSSLLLCDLGVAYHHLGRSDEAETVFLTASYMTPCYILPYYNLFLLYKDLGEMSKQIQMAEKIECMAVKVENKTTRIIRNEIKRFLQVLPQKKWLRLKSETVRGIFNYSFEANNERRWTMII